MSKESFSERFTVHYNAGPNKGMDKISVNMNPAVLSQIDLLVDNGYYSNRSDFINQAVREALGRQQTAIDRIVEHVGAKTGVDIPAAIRADLLS